METTSQGHQLPGVHRIFVSSTRIDLIAHRAEVRAALERLGQFAVTMEQFGAQDGDASTVSLEKVQSSEVYLGIIAWRYGYVPTGAVSSVTHQEYLEAKRLGLPCYLFLAAPETEQDDSPTALFPAALRDPEHRAQHLAFRDDLQRERVVDYFTTPADLAKRVATALYGWLEREQEKQRLQGPPAPRNLPLPPVDFIGREQELQTIIEALRPGQNVAPAVALAGMAGVGKSALAAQAVQRLAELPDAFPGGVTWFRCDSRSGLPGLIWLYDQILAAWSITLAPEELGQAATLEAEVELRERVLLARLHPASSAKPLPLALVLLDNVEHDLPLQQALETLGALNISVLLTTRIQLFAPNLRLVQLEVLAPAAAQHLFVTRFTSRGGQWNTERDEAPAAAVVATLGALPLAIELAAARAARTQCSVAALAQELQRSGVLSRLRDPLQKNMGVRYAFEQSLALLTPAQRVRFAALGLPDGADWPRPLIERVFAAVPPDDAEADPQQDDLDLLVALSLITLLTPEPPAERRRSTIISFAPRSSFSSFLALVTPDASAISPPATHPAVPRVRLHPLLRELAREEWARLPAEIQQAALMALLNAVGALIQEQQSNFAALAQEEDLIAGTLRRAAREQIAPEYLSEAIEPLFDYLSTGGHWRLGTELLTLQRNAQRDLGNRAGEGATLDHLGTLAMNLGRVEQAAWVFDQALAIRRAVQDRTGEGATLHNLGLIAYLQEQMEAAQQAFLEALAIARDVQDRQGEGAALTSLGLVAQTMGRAKEAEQLYQQALLIHRQVQNRRVEGITLSNLGSLAQTQGRHEEAARSYQQALKIQRKIGNRQGEAGTLSNLGLLAQTMGHRQEAARHHQQALSIQREIGDRRGEGLGLQQLGHLTRDQGQLQEAARYYRQAMQIFEELGAARLTAQAREDLTNLEHTRPARRRTNMPG